MRIINVVEVVDNNVLVGITSFGVFDESKVQDVVDKAEADFKAKAIENGCFLTDEEFESCFDDGYWEKTDYSVYIIWTDIEP
jgi:hypothetical protein